MKKTVCLFCFVAIALTGPLTAQVSDETMLTYDVIKTERKSLVMEALDLTPTQIQELSPIYDAYLAAAGEIDAREVKLIKAFLARHKSLADDDAKIMLKEIVEINQARLDLQRIYMGEFLLVLPARKVLRLWQVENKLDAMMDAQLVKDIPLAR